MQFPVVMDPFAEECEFPEVSRALSEPNGLLAIGGRLTPECLLVAYRRGIFPWFSAGQPVLWWSPDPRMVLFPGRIRISRSLRKTLRRAPYNITLDEAFTEVMKGCAQPRAEDVGTWITSDMIHAYTRLHELGYAHSAEAWQDGTLVGGVYGVAIGRVFFGESMFFRARDASKLAFVHLVRQLMDWEFSVIDCQMRTRHLERLGAEEIPRARFVELLSDCRRAPPPSPWRLAPAVVARCATGDIGVD